MIVRGFDVDGECTEVHAKKHVLVHSANGQVRVYVDGGMLFVNQTFPQWVEIINEKEDGE